MSWDISVIDTVLGSQIQHKISLQCIGDSLFVLQATDLSNREYEAHIDNQRCAIITDNILRLDEFLGLIRQRLNVDVIQSPVSKSRILRKVTSDYSSKIERNNRILPSKNDDRKYMRIRIPWRTQVQESFEKVSTTLNFDIFLFEKTKFDLQTDESGLIVRENAEHDDSIEEDALRGQPTFSEGILKRLDMIQSKLVDKLDNTILDTTQHSIKPLDEIDSFNVSKQPQIEENLISFVPQSAETCRRLSMGNSEDESEKYEEREDEVVYASWTSRAYFSALHSNKLIQWNGKEHMSSDMPFKRVFNGEEIIFLEGGKFQVTISAWLPQDIASKLFFSLHLDGEFFVALDSNKSNTNTKEIEQKYQDNSNKVYVKESLVIEIHRGQSVGIGILPRTVCRVIQFRCFLHSICLEYWILTLAVRF